MKNWLSTGKSHPLTGPAGAWLSMLLPGGVLLAFLAAWELVVNHGAIEPWILPSPRMILGSFWQSRELIWQHSLPTLAETALGLGIAVLAGIVIATLMDYWEWLGKAVYPLLVISQTVPIIALAPLLIIWFGYGLWPKVMVVALVCFFPVAVNLADGYRLADRDMIHLLSAMGARKSQIFRLVKIPGALPFFFSGLRIAGTYSVMGAVIGEWLGASKGLGILMTRSSQSFLTDRVFATIMIISVLSLGVVMFIEIMARAVMPWHYRQEELCR